MNYILPKATSYAVPGHVSVEDSCEHEPLGYIKYWEILGVAA